MRPATSSASLSNGSSSQRPDRTAAGYLGYLCDSLETDLAIITADHLQRLMAPDMGADLTVRAMMNSSIAPDMGAALTGTGDNVHHHDSALVPEALPGVFLLRNRVKQPLHGPYALSLITDCDSQLQGHRGLLGTGGTWAAHGTWGAPSTPASSPGTWA